MNASGCCWLSLWAMRNSSVLVVLLPAAEPPSIHAVAACHFRHITGLAYGFSLQYWHHAASYAHACRLQEVVVEIDGLS